MKNSQKMENKVPETKPFDANYENVPENLLNIFCAPKNPPPPPP